MNATAISLVGTGTSPAPSPTPFTFTSGSFQPGRVRVLSFRGREVASRPFRFDLTVTVGSADAPELEARLLGQPAELTMEVPGGDPRCVCGIVAAVEARDAFDQDRLAFRLRLVPRLWLLGPSGSTGGETTPPIVKRPTWPVIVAGGAAVVALGVGTGLAVAANGKRSDFDALGMTVGNGAACAGTPAASLAMNCQALKNDAASHDSLTKGALGGFVAGGVLAATAVGLGVWATGRRSPTAERTGVRMVPLLGRGEAGLGVAGAW